METKKNLVYADKIGYDLEKAQMRIASRAMLQRLLQQSGYEDKKQNSFCLSLVATSEEIGGGGKLGNLGIEEFLEAFKVFKMTVDTDAKKAVWSLTAEMTEKKEKKEDAENLHTFFVCVSFIDDDADFLAIGWAKPGKKNLRRKSSTKIAKEKAQKTAEKQAQNEIEKEEKEIKQAKNREKWQEDASAFVHKTAVKFGLTDPKKLADFDKEIKEFFCQKCKNFTFE